MSPEERADRLRCAAGRVDAILSQLRHVASELVLWVDQQAMRELSADLAEAAERCRVVALHQVGQAMENHLGCSIEFLRWLGERKTSSPAEYKARFAEMKRATETPAYGEFRKRCDALRQEAMMPLPRVQTTRTGQQRHDPLRQLAGDLWTIEKDLQQLPLPSESDTRALAAVLTDLTWAVENCTVICLHQINRAMNDAMGYTSDGQVR